MDIEIRSNATKGTPRNRGKGLWLAGLWVVSGVFWGPTARAEILHDEEGIQLRGTVRIVARNAATCHVLEESHTEARYEEIKGKDGHPLHVWELEYSAHNQTGKALSYLRADFVIESAYPPCTNWTGEGPGHGATGGPYSGGVFWGDHAKTLSAPYGMGAGEVMQEVLYLAVFHTDEPSFERWSTHFTFGEPDPSARRPDAPTGNAAPSSGGPDSASASAIPPEVRLDEYLLEAEMLSEENDPEGALAVLDRIAALQKEHNLELPEEYPFQYAQTALAAGSYQAAIESVNRYLSVAGRGGKHYREALAVLVKSKRGLRAPADAVGRTARRTDASGGQRVQPRARERLPYEPEMVEIPGGSFRMGCVSGRYCQDDEQPVHEVQVESFELGKYEVTFEEYDRFTAATGRERASDVGWGRGRLPVIFVSWEDAVAYTRWLSEQTGERYRLPSEAEWEYAARAGSVTVYSWGNEIGSNRAHCFGCGSQWDGEQTAPVGSFDPNGWGLHDLHGSVWEWVQDCWNEDYYGSPKDGSAWESGDCSQRVLRGGSWVNFPRLLRSALRFRIASTFRSLIIGLRVARTITP